MRSVDRRRLLQPRTAGEMIDFSAKMYHKLAWPILRLTLPSMTLLFAGLVFFQGFVLPGLLTTTNPDDINLQVQELMFVYAVALFVALPVVVVALGHSVGLTTRLISEYVLEQKVDFAAAIASARKGALAMIGLLLHIFLRAGIVLIAAGAFMVLSAYANQAGLTVKLGDFAAFFAVAGLIVGCVTIPVVFANLALAPAVAAVEDAPPRLAMRRGKVLMRRSGHITSGYDTLVHVGMVALFVALVLWIGFNSAFSVSGLSDVLTELSGQSVLASIFAETVMTLPTFAAVWVLVPFMTCCVTVLYFDRRVRLEALDIETMAHDVFADSRKADLRD